MDWFFRGRFRNNPRDNIFDPNDQEYEDKDGHEGMRNSLDIPFVDPFENLEDTSHDLFRRMDDMLSRMFSASFGALESENFSDQVQNESNPRSMMLKEPDCGSCDSSPYEFPIDSRQPSAFVDSDIDEKVSKNKGLLKESPFQKTEPNFFYKFSSVKTVRLPDGSLEEHRTFTDSQGSTTTTVRRSIGDQSYEVTTHSDEKGLKEKDEKLINLDESDLPNFEKKWQNIKSENIPVPILDVKSKPLEPKLNPPAGDPSYASLFKKFFGF